MSSLSSFSDRDLLVSIGSALSLESEDETLNEEMNLLRNQLVKQIKNNTRIEKQVRDIERRIQLLMNNQAKLEQVLQTKGGLVRFIISRKRSSESALGGHSLPTLQVLTPLQVPTPTPSRETHEMTMYTTGTTTTTLLEDSKNNTNSSTTSTTLASTTNTTSTTTSTTPPPPPPPNSNSNTHLLSQEGACTLFYSHLFYILQTEPIYLSRLLYMVPSDKLDTFLESVILSLYGYAFSAREEYLLLRLFNHTLQMELDHSSKVSSFLSSNPVLPKMILTYGRRIEGKRFLQKYLFEPFIAPLLEEKDLTLELNAVKILKEHISKQEVETGVKCGINLREITYEKAIQHDFIRRIVENRVRKLSDICSNILRGLCEHVQQVPYGLRWISKQFNTLLEEQVPHSTPIQRASVIGYLIYYRFCNPSIVACDAFLLTRKKISLSMRNNLVNISKVLTNLTNNVLFDSKVEQPMVVMNQWIKDHQQYYMDHFITPLIDVEDPEEALGVHQYLELTQRQTPSITISVNDLIQTHQLLWTFRDQICSSPCGGGQSGSASGGSGHLSGGSGISSESIGSSGNSSSDNGNSSSSGSGNVDPLRVQLNLLGDPTPIQHSIVMNLLWTHQRNNSLSSSQQHPSSSSIITSSITSSWLPSFHTQQTHKENPTTTHHHKENLFSSSLPPSSPVHLSVSTPPPPPPPLIPPPLQQQLSSSTVFNNNHHHSHHYHNNNFNNNHHHSHHSQQLHSSSSSGGLMSEEIQLKLIVPSSQLDQYEQDSTILESPQYIYERSKNNLKSIIRNVTSDHLIVDSMSETLHNCEEYFKKRMSASMSSDMTTTLSEEKARKLFNKVQDLKRDLMKLEELKILVPKETTTKYRKLLMDIIKEIQNKKYMREKQRREIQRLQDSLTQLTEHYQFLIEKTKSLREFIDDCRKRQYETDLKNKKKKNTIYKFTYKQLHDKNKVIHEMHHLHKTKMTFYIAMKEPGVFRVESKLDQTTVGHFTLIIDALLDAQEKGQHLLSVDDLMKEYVNHSQQQQNHASSASPLLPQSLASSTTSSSTSTSSSSLITTASATTSTTTSTTTHEHEAESSHGGSHSASSPRHLKIILNVDNTLNVLNKLFATTSNH
nr:unnamed protein product [Naegleria fowleri]